MCHRTSKPKIFICRLYKKKINAVTAAFTAAAVDPLLGKLKCLYWDSSRDILGNIAESLGKSIGLGFRDFPWAQAIFPRISLLSSQYRLTTVAANADPAIVVKLIASVEELLAAMVTCSCRACQECKRTSFLKLTTIFCCHFMYTYGIFS